MIDTSFSQMVELKPHKHDEVSAPVLEPPRSLNELLHSRVKSDPDVPLIGYPSSATSAVDYTFYTPRQMNRFANHAATYLSTRNILPNVH